jgi:hypothetical protein
MFVERVILKHIKDKFTKYKIQYILPCFTNQSPNGSLMIIPKNISDFGFNIAAICLYPTTPMQGQVDSKK